MKLYLVRHGETALNEKGCYYGKTDAVLSVRGIEQAKYLQHIFKEVSFDYVVASPLVRAYNTAQIIIEERKLKKYVDIDVTGNDVLLENALEEKADDRLKNIVATIQDEQNKIIRAPINKPLIVKGVAGSRKNDYCTS